MASQTFWKASSLPTYIRRRLFQLKTFLPRKKPASRFHLFFAKKFFAAYEMFCWKKIQIQKQILRWSQLLAKLFFQIIELLLTFKAMCCFKLSEAAAAGLAKNNQWITNTLDFYPGLHSKSLNIFLTLLYSKFIDFRCHIILIKIIYLNLLR